jgi:hypothetical protein
MSCLVGMRRSQPALEVAILSKGDDEKLVEDVLLAALNELGIGFQQGKNAYVQAYVDGFASVLELRCDERHGVVLSASTDLERHGGARRGFGKQELTPDAWGEGGSDPRT